MFRVFVKLEAYIDIECDTRDEAIKCLGRPLIYEFEDFELAGMTFHSTDFDIDDVDVAPENSEEDDA